MVLDSQALLTDVRREGDFRLMTVRSAAIAREARPGQFVMVKPATGTDPLLRRPFGIHDRSGDELSLLFKVVGRGTALLGERRTGETLDVLGPLGRGFREPELVSGKVAYLVGGGRGIAPLYFLAGDLHAAGAKVRLFYGGRTASELAFRDRFERACWTTRFATDDGSAGFAGVVCDLAAREMDRRRPDILYACGPDAMMKVLAGMCRERDVPAQFSLEAVMGCGIGACWGCVCRIRSGGAAAWTKICQDGPVFDRDDVVWPGEG